MIETRREDLLDHDPARTRIRVYAEPGPRQKFHRLVQLSEDVPPVFACDFQHARHDLMEVAEAVRLDGSQRPYDRMYACSDRRIDLCRRCFR